MTLSDEEHQWALDLKARLEAAGLSCLSDFTCAQVALAVHGDIESGMERAHGMQAFLKEYDVVNSQNQGAQCVQELLDACPGSILYLCNQPGIGALIACDLSKAHHISSPVFLRGCYYLAQATQTDLQQMRQGVSAMFDCQWKEMSQTNGWKEYLKFWAALPAWYPQRKKQIAAYHTSSTANIRLSMARKLLPPQEQDCARFGGLVLERTLNQTCMVSSGPEATRQSLLAAVSDGLTRRYDNDLSFSLED